MVQPLDKRILWIWPGWSWPGAAGQAAGHPLEGDGVARNGTRLQSTQALWGPAGGMAPCGPSGHRWLCASSKGLQRESGCPCRELQITRACGFCVKRLRNGDRRAEATRLQSDHDRACGWGSPSIPPLCPAKSLQPPLLRKPPTVLISKEKY